MALLLKIKSLTKKTSSSHFPHHPQPRQKQTLSVKTKKREIVDDNSSDPQQWIKFSDNIIDDTHFTLYQGSKSNIANPNGWLTDSELHAAQQLLKAQFPYLDGLYDPDILSGDLVTLVVAEFVQIINTDAQ